MLLPTPCLDDYKQSITHELNPHIEGLISRAETVLETEEKRKKEMEERVSEKVFRKRCDGFRYRIGLYHDTKDG